MEKACLAGCRKDHHQANNSWGFTPVRDISQLSEHSGLRLHNICCENRLWLLSSVLKDVQILWLQLSIPIIPSENLRCKSFVSLWNSPVIDCSKLLCCKFSVWHLPVNATNLLIIFLKVLRCLLFLLSCKFLYTLIVILTLINTLYWIEINTFSLFYIELKILLAYTS